jgi:putative ABC transport system substrate-binding protein
VAAPPGVTTAEDAARKLGVDLQVVRARTPEEFEPAFRTMTHGRAQALLILADGMFFAHRGRLADLAVVHRLPTMFATKEYAQAGGLMTYGPSYPDLFRRAAIYVDKIFRGAKPADLPVEQATKFELIINLKTAKTLSLTIPQSLLQRADQVIE